MLKTVEKREPTTYKGKELISIHVWAVSHFHLPEHHVPCCRSQDGSPIWMPRTEIKREKVAIKGETWLLINSYRKSPMDSNQAHNERSKDVEEPRRESRVLHVDGQEDGHHWKYLSRTKVN